MMKILIIKTSALGDIIHTYPTIDYLHSVYPDAQIDWVVESGHRDLVRSHPLISHTLVIATKKWRKAVMKRQTWNEIKAFRKELRAKTYDLAYDLQGNVKSGLILSQVRAKRKVGFAWDQVPEKPNLVFTNERYGFPPNQNIREDYLAVIRSSLQDKSSNVLPSMILPVDHEEINFLAELMQNPTLKSKKRVIVCPGSAWKNKQMDPRAFASFLELMQSYLNCSFLFAWGTEEEKDNVMGLQTRFPGNSFVLNKMPLPLLQNVMAHCDLVVAMDSLPLHLAGATHTPTFSIFGPSSAIKYRPIGPHHGYYQGKCPYGRSFEKRCPILRTCPTGACIRMLTGSEVFESFKEWYRV